MLLLRLVEKTYLFYLILLETTNHSRTVSVPYMSARNAYELIRLIIIHCISQTALKLTFCLKNLSYSWIKANAIYDKKQIDCKGSEKKFNSLIFAVFHLFIFLRNC